MKKTLSVILAVLMLACYVPFVYAANQYTFTESAEFTSSDQLADNTEYIIPDGVTMTVKAGKTLFVPSNTRITVQKGGTLNVAGTLAVLAHGSIWCAGNIDHSSHISLEDDTAAVMVEFRFPNLSNDEIRLADKITVSCTYDGMDESADPNIPVGGKSFYVPLDAEVKIDAHIIEPDGTHDKFDDSLLKVKFNNVGLSYVTGPTAGTGYYTTVATTGGDISYTRWTNDNDFLTTKKIILPSGEGYEVKSRFPVTKTEDGVIVVKYGDPFSFYVELDEAYDMSNYEVYIHDGYGWMLITAPNNVAAQPDDYGYYNIPAVEGDITVTVTGVMKNETITLIGNLLETFRNIFNMLKEFFASFKELFSGFGGN